jgi:peptidyl-prolyl cis-trans isomerase D
MKEELTESLRGEFAQEKLYDLTSQIEGLMDESVSFEDIAKETGVTLQSFDYIDRLGQTRDGVKMSGIAHLLGVAEDDIILQEIFTNDLGYETDLFETSNGGWAAVKVTSVVDSVLRPFDEVKDQAIAMWKTLQVDEAINELMLETASKAQTGTPLDDLAKEIGSGASIEETILVRSAQSDVVGPTVAVGLLEGKVGDIKRGQGLKPLTRQIAELTAIVANTDGLAGQFSDVLQEQASVAIRADLQRAYQNAVIAENPLVEKPEKIKSLLGIDSDS